MIGSDIPYTRPNRDKGLYKQDKVEEEKD